MEVAGEAASLDSLPGPPPEVDAFVMAHAGLLADDLRAAIGDTAPALVLLSDDDQAIQALGSLPIRGWAVVPEDASAADLHAAIAAATQGLVALPLTLGRRLLTRSHAVQSLDIGLTEEPLTARELEVLEQLAQGLSNKLIARRLNISEHTVKFHVSSIYTKLNASSRTEAVSRGARLGLITL